MWYDFTGKANNRMERERDTDMYNIRKVTDDITWIGASDRRLALFENIFPISRGVSYNSYILLDEQTVLFDTGDASVAGQFFENLEHVLGNRPLDYMIVNHMEPDHCAIVEDVVRRFPEVKVVGNAKTFNMMKQFFTFDVDAHAVVIKEGDTISVVMNEHVDYNGKTYPIASLPENLMSIIRAGGLVKAMRKLNGLD